MLECFMKSVNRFFKAAGAIIATLFFLLLCMAGYHQAALKFEVNEITPNGQMVDLGDYSVHVYTEGENRDAPTLVFLSGSATVAPVYDFKQLYKLLSDEYKIAVVEKAGYGYSDIAEVDRDVRTMVTEVKNALTAAGITGPYLLLPHSMSGLEAIYWAQNYADEVAGIVGLDMAVPGSYDSFDFCKVDRMIYFGGTVAKLGLLRIPGIYPLHVSSLADREIRQQKLLMYRNAVNIDYILEGKSVYANAQTVKSGKDISCPLMMFSSNGTEIGDFWIPSQEKYAVENDAELIIYDCGHYIHYYKSQEIASAVKTFLKQIG
jgi:pimeloyl-ACP methyl ester carboxylesterase